MPEFTFVGSATFKVQATTESKVCAALTKALRDGSGFDASHDRIDMFFDMHMR